MNGYYLMEEMAFPVDEKHYHSSEDPGSQDDALVQ